MAETKISFPVFMGIEQSAEEIPLSLSPNAQNVDTRKGTLRRCKGYAPYSDFALDQPIVGLLKFHKRSNSGYEEILIASTHSALYCLGQNGWTKIQQGRNGGKYSYINYMLGEDDVIFMSNGVDFPVKWDGTTAQELGQLPRFSCITLHFERMWGAGVPNEPDRIYYSVAFDPQDFTTPEQSGFIDIPTFDGGSVIAVKTIFNEVVVFKSDCVFRVFGTYPGTYQIDKIYGIVGPVAKDSIVSTGSRVFFLSRQGLCLYDGNQTVPFASLKIRDLMSRINPTYVKNAVGVFYDNIYLIALPMDDNQVNNAVIEYDTVKNTFMLKYGLRVDSFLEYGQKLLISNGTGVVYEYNKGDTFGGEPIHALWETPFMDLGFAGSKKELLRMETHGCGGNLKLSWFLDSKVKEKLMCLKPTLRYKRTRMYGKGRRIKFRFENVEGGDFEILPPDVYVDMER